MEGVDVKGTFGDTRNLILCNSELEIRSHHRPGITVTAGSLALKLSLMQQKLHLQQPYRQCLHES